MAEQDLCAAAAVRPGALHQVTLGRRDIVLTRLPDGAIRAFAARCPHHGAPLAAGCVGGEVAVNGAGPCVKRVGEVVRCPWHGFEFDLVTGAPLVEAPAGLPMQLRFYETAERDGRVVLKT
jgi:nitrite reductase/ring-hydroxylating ferredoxin subunit